LTEHAPGSAPSASKQALTQKGLAEPGQQTVRQRDAARELVTLRNPVSPLESAARARRYGSLYFAEHWLRTLKGYGWTVALTAVGTPLVYLFAMGIGLAALVDRNAANNASADLDPAFLAADGRPVAYLVFVAPALLATAAIMTATEENTYSIMSGFKWRRTYYGPNASPLSTGQLVNGHALGVLLRLLATVTVYFCFLLVFGAVPQGSGWLMIFTAVLGGMAFGLPLMAYASGLEEDKGQFALVQRFIVMPLFLFSGTFFPLAAMPPFLQWIGWLSPLWHSTSLGRVLSYGYQEPAWLMAAHLLYLPVLALMGWLLARRNYARRLGR
jgi:lipooligosaccharide transport system permease protein